MPATPNPNELEFTGRNMLRSNVSRHPAQSDIFVAFADLYVDGGDRIRKRRGTGAPLGANAGSPITGLAEYEFVDPNTGLSTFFKFRTFAKKIQRWTGAAWTDETLPIIPPSGAPWSFLNLKNRIFACCGVGACTGTVTVTNGSAAVTGTGSLFTTELAANYVLRIAGQTVSVSSITNNLALTLTAPWGGVTGTYAFTSDTKGSLLVFDGTSWRVAGIDAPGVAPVYILSSFASTGTVSAVNGSPVIHSTIGPVWNNTVMPGKWIDINGVRYKISTVDVFGGGLNQQLTLTESFKEVTPDVWTANTHLKVGQLIQPTVGAGRYYAVTSITTGITGGVEPVWPTGGSIVNGGVTFTTTVGLTYKIWDGLMDWVIGPKYSYDWYNPITGHGSNESPVVEVTEQNQVGVTPTVTIPGSVANTLAYNAGYTQIRIFRTPKNANRRVAISTTLANNNTGSSIVWIETSNSSTDVALTQDSAPIATNTKPPTGIAALAQYQGRPFGVVPTDTPPRVYFGSIDEELPFGRGEESWPARFNRVVTRPTGILSVGTAGLANSLIMQTGNGDFTLDGYDQLSYTNPIQMPTRSSGGFFGGAIESHGGLVEFYRDKRWWDFAHKTQSPLGTMTTAIDIGEPIQDKLNALSALTITSSRLFWFSYEQMDYLLLSIAKSGSSTNNDILVEDHDRGALYEWNFGFSAAASVHNAATGALEMWIGTPAGDVFTLLQTIFTDNGASYAPTFKTAHIRQEEGTQQLRHIKLFVGPTASNPASLTWTVNVYLDEETVPSYTMPASAVPAMWQSSQGLELWVSPEKALRSNVFQVEVVFPSTTTDLFVDKMILVFSSDQIDEAGS